MENLYLIRIKTNIEKGFIFDIIQQSYENKNKTFKITRKDDMFETIKMLKKDKLMKVDTIFTNNIHPICYHIYCYESEIDKAKEKLLNSCLKRIEYLKFESDKLQEMLKIYSFNK